MKFDFTYYLDLAHKEEWLTFLDRIELQPVEQNPDWPSIEAASLDYCYFTARDDKEIVTTAIISENKKGIFKSANIQFGPLYKDADSLIASVQAIDQHYRHSGFMSCSIQLATLTGREADYIEYQLSKSTKINYRFDRYNWSSLIIRLQASEEELLRNCSKGHKSDIKKAIKNDISVVSTEDINEFNIFTDIFLKMHRERHLGINESESKEFEKRVFEFLKEKDKGKLLLVKNAVGNILGGVMIIFQGRSVRYFKGASDIAYRHLPVLHLAIWEAIRISKLAGFDYFDLWGYNHYVNESDQVYFINRFKKGFGGEFVFYPKKIYLSYKPFLSNIFEMLKRFRRAVKRNN